MEDNIYNENKNFLNLKYMENQSNNFIDNKNQYYNLSSLNNQYPNMYQQSNEDFNNIYNNNNINNYSNIEKIPMINQNNMNMLNNFLNNQNNNPNYNIKHNIDKSMNIDYDTNKTNNSMLSQISNNNKNNKSLNNSNMEIKVKNNSKRNNYIPKNLIALQNQTFNQKKLNKNINIPVQDPYMSLPNMYYNNILSSDHKGSLDSQESNRKNSSNYNNSPNYESDKNFRNIANDVSINFYDNEDSGNNYNEKRFKPYSYIFEANINEVKEILTDNLFFKNSCPSSIIDNVQFTINNFSDTEGNIISFRWKKFYTLQLMCTKTFKSKTSIIYTLTLINLKPVNIGSLEMTFKYYYNTCQNNTLFMIEYLLDKGILSEVFKEEFLDIDMNEICRNCEKILSMKKKENIHLSSIFFKTPMEKAWNFLIDLSKNKYLKYMDEYEIFYLSENDNENNINKNINKDENNEKNNNYLKKGDYILIKRNKNKIFAKITVDDIKKEVHKNEIICSCDKYKDEDINSNGNNNINNNKDNDIKDNIEIIKQKISLSFEEITKNMTYCEFKHIWNDQISDEKIKILNFLKNNSLILFKKKLQNEDNNNCKKNKELNNEEKKEENNILNLFNLLCPVKK